MGPGSIDGQSSSNIHQETMMEIPKIIHVGTYRGLLQYWLSLRNLPIINCHEISLASISVIKSSWSCVQSTTVSLPYSLQNLKMISWPISTGEGGGGGGLYCNIRQGSSFSINTLRPSQYGRHFADDIFKCILKKWKCMNVDKDIIEICSCESK